MSELMSFFTRLRYMVFLLYLTFLVAFGFSRKVFTGNNYVTDGFVFTDQFPEMFHSKSAVR